MSQSLLMEQMVSVSASSHENDSDGLIESAKSSSPAQGVSCVDIVEWAEAELEVSSVLADGLRKFGNSDRSD